ncbi:unnamed protein product [Peniophora sp. CBMAI 1063]|nr:unnamed protein product [Peniophora sp. CBMAI 1063]
MSTPDDIAAQLAEIKDDIISMADYRIYPVILESVLFALYTVLMIFHCIKYSHDKKRAVGIFAVSICLFIMCAATWALDVWILSLELYRFLPSRASPGGTANPLFQALKELNGTATYARALCNIVIFIFCDSISLWRAYLIYGRPRWLRVVCYLIFVASSAFYIVNVLLRAGDDLANPPPSTVHLSKLDHGALLWLMGSASRGSTVLAQVFATILIARKVVSYRKEIKDLMPTHGGPHNSRRLIAVLYVVVETGVVYSLLWVIYFVSNLGVLGETGGYWGDYWMCQLSGICPTLIVVVVSQRSSILEQAHISYRVWSSDCTRSLCLQHGYRA